MTTTTEPEIDSCSFLFLREIEEGQAGPIPVSIEVGDTAITDCHAVSSTEQSRMFEVVWNRYVAYSVRNESFVAFDHSEVAHGSRFRVYSKSHFLDFVRSATFATEEYPGPRLHLVSTAKTI
jgi:hypothetical protein